MPLLNEWIDARFSEIANKLPTLVHTEPASFSCGYNMGFKQAILDLDNFMNDLKEFPHELESIYHKKFTDI